MLQLTRLTLAFTLITFVALGCSSDAPSGSGGGGGSETGGATGGGGTGGGGAGTGGKVGTGGSPGTGGNIGTGGSVGTGGSGGGGTGGEAGGTGGGAGGTGGNGGTMGSIDQCFAGLPPRVGVQQIDSKASADGRVRLRMALDSEGFAGLQTPWQLIRFAIERDGVVTCVKDRSQLVYKSTHHNCLDTATVTAGSTKYELTRPNFVSAQISASGAAALGTTTVQTTTCTNSSGQCQRGGPCQ